MENYNKAIQQIQENYNINKKSARACYATQNFIAISDRQKSKTLSRIIEGGKN